MTALIVMLLVTVLSAAGNVIQHYRLNACQAERALATSNVDAAVSANEANLSTIDTVQGALNACIGQRDTAAYQADVAEADRAAALRAAGAARQAQREAQRAALESPTCRANAELPVCPGLIQ